MGAWVVTDYAPAYTDNILRSGRDWPLLPRESIVSADPSSVSVCCEYAPHYRILKTLDIVAIASNSVAIWRQVTADHRLQIDCRSIADSRPDAGELVQLRIALRMNFERECEWGTCHTVE